MTTTIHWIVAQGSRLRFLHPAHVEKPRHVTATSTAVFTDHLPVPPKSGLDCFAAAEGVVGIRPTTVDSRPKPTDLPTCERAVRFEFLHPKRDFSQWRFWGK